MEAECPTTQDLEYSIRLILSAFDKPEREGLTETPKRVIKAYKELLVSDEPKITIFDSKGYNQMITDSNIEFYSLCEHHLLPFFGDVKISYIPDKKIIGLSKLSRIVDYFARRLNTQEYLTQNIANYIQDKLNPLGVGVMIQARHLCKEMRGIRKKGIMTTTALIGVYMNENVKQEFLQA